MNLSAMQKDLRSRKPVKGNSLLESVNRGTYSKEDVTGFFKGIKAGLTKNESARQNNIPKGSVWHVFNSVQLWLFCPSMMRILIVSAQELEVRTATSASAKMLRKIEKYIAHSLYSFWVRDFVRRPKAGILP